MSITKEILQFGSQKARFSRKELIDYLGQKQTALPKSVSQQLHRLVKNNCVVRLEQGIYILSTSSMPSFTIHISDELKQLNQQLRKQFPFASYCLWSADTLIPYMHHLPNLKYIYVDVERDATEAVFHFLHDSTPKSVFLSPKTEDYSRYIIGKDAIIVRTLISESPLQRIENILTPSIEKILVDIVGDIDFEFLQGAEMSVFYRYVMERHPVNTSKLLRYASRRGRRTEVEQLYNNAL